MFVCLIMFVHCPHCLSIEEENIPQEEENLVDTEEMEIKPETAEADYAAPTEDQVDDVEGRCRLFYRLKVTLRRFEHSSG